MMPAADDRRVPEGYPPGAVAVACPKPWCAAPVGQPCKARVWGGPKSWYSIRERPHKERLIAARHQGGTLDAY